MKRLNVRWRLTLWYGAVLTAILVGFGACVYVMMQRHLLARTDFELDEELTELALEVRLAKDDEDLQEQLERRIRETDQFAVFLFLRGFGDRWHGGDWGFPVDDGLK